jgi:hypothetical protein
MVPGSNELHPVRSSTGARVADTRGYTLGASANAKPERATGAARPRPSVESRRCTPTVLAVRTPSAMYPWTRNTAVTELQGGTPWDEKTARIAAYTQPAGRFTRVWQVLGSNQRRLSRRFYSPLGPPE